VAQENAAVSARNAVRMLEVYQALGAQGPVGLTEEQYDAALADVVVRDNVGAAIARQAEHFDMLGLQLGFAYEAGAIVPDGTDRPAVGNTVREFVPNARPGARLPHAWVRGDGGVRSTLDLLSFGGFTLVTGPDGGAWARAAAALAGSPLTVLAIGRDVPDEDGAWRAQLGIGPAGALLVRPDQHVAWRSADAAADPLDALRAALRQILGA
jgi:2,4-dichlorophenol 6-monooxygenase